MIMRSSFRICGHRTKRVWQFSADSPQPTAHSKSRSCRLSGSGCRLSAVGC